MTSAECNLCKLLIRKYYGNIVSLVGEFLCRNGPQPLFAVARGTKLKAVLVRKALCVLVQHKLVTFATVKRRYEYKFQIENGIQLLHTPKIIYTAKLLYSDPGELIVEETLVHGKALKDKTIKTVVKRLKETTEKASVASVEKVYNDLLDARLLTKESSSETELANADETTEKSQENGGGDGGHSLMGGVGKRKLSDDDGPNAKQRKGEDYYSVNYERFAQYFRDQLIVDAITHKFNVSCGEIIRTLLCISEVTTSAEEEVTKPISSNEIMHALPSGVVLTMEYIEQYLTIMANDADNYVQKSDESSSGTYVVNIKKCIKALCIANVLSYIQERYGSKSCRIFKLLMLKEHMEQKQVEDFAMIPSKEAKELLYSLLSENLLVMQELAKTADHAPSRTYYLFNVNFPKVVRTLISRTYKTLVNLIARQESEMKNNRRLLEKRERLDSIKANAQDLDAEQVEEIEEMLTMADRANLTKLEYCCDKLGKSQIQVANTAFLLNLYLR